MKGLVPGLGAVVLVALALPVWAAHEPKMPVADKDYRSAPAGVYRLDPHHASITWRIEHMGLSTFVGRFDDISATLVYDPANPTAVQMRGQVEVDKIDTGNPVLDATLKGAPFFDAEHFPRITLVARQLTLSGANHGQLLADVTLRGVTRPVLFELVFNGHNINPYEGNAAEMGFSAKGSLKRSDFGMKGFPGALGERVDIALEGEFVRH
jgi:polyisoprenoid-binding protein YceI